MLTMIEKPKDKGETQNCIGIMSDLVDRSDEVVVGGTTERVLKARFVCCMPEEQRSDARDSKSTRGVPWQQTSAETAGGELANTACVASLRSTETVGSVVGEKWNWQNVDSPRIVRDAETAPERPGCATTRARRLRTVKERLGPAASAARAKVAPKGQASLARVEVSQKCRDGEMAEAVWDEKR